MINLILKLFLLPYIRYNKKSFSEVFDIWEPFHTKTLSASATLYDALIEKYLWNILVRKHNNLESFDCVEKIGVNHSWLSYFPELDIIDNEYCEVTNEN